MSSTSGDANPLCSSKQLVMHPCTFLYIHPICTINRAGKDGMSLFLLHRRGATKLVLSFFYFASWLERRAPAREREQNVFKGCEGTNEREQARESTMAAAFIDFSPPAGSQQSPNHPPTHPRRGSSINSTVTGVQCMRLACSHSSCATQPLTFIYCMYFVCMHIYYTSARSVLCLLLLRFLSHMWPSEAAAANAE
jgi:hypothetical protein